MAIFKSCLYYVYQVRFYKLSTNKTKIFVDIIRNSLIKILSKNFRNFYNFSCRFNTTFTFINIFFINLNL